MVRVNENYLKLNENYLFADIAKKVEQFRQSYPERKILRLGIGDVTLPLAPAIIEALHQAVDEMEAEETFHGYAPVQGYEFLRNAIAKHEFQERGCQIFADEIFISDGAKSDASNLQEIFGENCKIAVCDPVYPVYVEANVMAGRAGEYDGRKSRWSEIIYLPCTAEHEFLPEFPKETPDLIYLCFPNNPTGSVMARTELQQWVDYANRMGAVIIYDAAYEAYITEKGIPHSIFECDGARTCAIEIRSFSKNAGFTGMRLGAAIIPKDIKRGGVSLHSLWKRRQGSKYNGTGYLIQKAGMAVYTEEGARQIKGQIAYYLNNAAYIYERLKAAGYSVWGGENAPYIWLKTPDQMSSWAFFDHLLERTGVVGTPGAGFGAGGEGYFRLSAFGRYEDVKEAVERICFMV